MPTFKTGSLGNVKSSGTKDDKEKLQRYMEFIAKTVKNLPMKPKSKGKSPGYSNDEICKKIGRAIYRYEMKQFLEFIGP